jgi:hypothetical protein
MESVCYERRSQGRRRTVLSEERLYYGSICVGGERESCYAQEKGGNSPGQSLSVCVTGCGVLARPAFFSLAWLGQPPKTSTRLLKMTRTVYIPASTCQGSGSHRILSLNLPQQVSSHISSQQFTRTWNHAPDLISNLARTRNCHSTLYISPIGQATTEFPSSHLLRRQR